MESPSVTSAGFSAAISFLVFAGIGSATQVYKLWSRHRQFKQGLLRSEEVCAGLHPTRELWSYAAFLLFALSGTTRSYFDWFLVVSRTPVVIFSTITLGFLARHSVPSAQRYFIISLCGTLALGAAVIAGLNGSTLSGAVAASSVDATLAAVSLLLFYGKSSQALRMYRSRQAGAVSYTREIGLVCKDLAGLWYALVVGAELTWIGVTHALSAMSSGAIVLAKVRVEARSGNPSTSAVP